MIKLSYRRNKIDKNLVFFHNGEELDLPKCDIISFRESRQKPNCKYTEKFTLITNLHESEEELLAKIDKTYRYEIRRAKEKDNLKIDIIDSNKLTKNDIDKFESFFNEFAKTKGLGCCDRKLMDAFFTNMNLVIAFVYDESQEDKSKALIVAHAYYVSDKIARLWYSCSHFRDGDGQYKNLVGRANRLLHWEDICWFKNAGYDTLDWGGAGKADDVKNISKFKRGFGGSDATFYNYDVAKTFKGKVFLFIKRLLGK